MDANRDKIEAAQNNIFAERAFDEFHYYISSAREEIIQKTRSLKGVMEPFSDKGNLGILKRAGFEDIIPIFQWLCFKGYMCIK